MHCFFFFLTFYHMEQNGAEDNLVDSLLGSKQNMAVYYQGHLQYILLLTLCPVGCY